MQYRIIAEHQLENKFPIAPHGCHIPEKLLAENRLTNEEKEQVKAGAMLVPWVSGKLSIQQVAFLVKEFGGDMESVQNGLVNGGGWYLSMCAGIVHDENYYEKTSDGRFNYQRRDMARIILERYDHTEDDWIDNHSLPDNRDNFGDILMPDYTKLK
jgi:hypothetical protein